MKFSSKRVMAAAALAVAVLCAAPAGAQKPGDQGRKSKRTFVRLRDEAKPDGFDVETRDDEVIGVTLVRKGGRRIALKRQTDPAPTMGTSCQGAWSCWEDEEQLMSICVCGPRPSSHFRLILQGD